MKISKKELKRFIRESMIKPSVGDPDFDERIKELGPYGDELASSMGYEGQFSRDTAAYEFGVLIKYLRQEDIESIKHLRKEDIESISQVIGRDIEITGDEYGFVPYEIWDTSDALSDTILIDSDFYHDMLARIIQGDRSFGFSDYIDNYDLGLAKKFTKENINLAHENLLSAIIKVSNRAEVSIDDIESYRMGNITSRGAIPEYNLNEPFKTLEDMGKLVVK